MIAPHAVPQNILDVEFKLFGSLTVKQFAYIAGSAFLAILIYFIFNSLPWLAWPLILASVGLGLALALVKINQRTFDIWLTNYITAVMGSQRSIYKKSRKTVDVLEGLQELSKSSGINDTKTKMEESLVSELNLLPLAEERRNKLDIDEETNLRNLKNLFESVNLPSVPVDTSPKKEIEKTLEVQKSQVVETNLKKDELVTINSASNGNTLKNISVKNNINQASSVQKLEKISYMLVGFLALKKNK